MLDFKYSRGNKKIPKSTLIYNMGSATTCAAKLKGLCNIDCYALKSEKMYPNVLPARNHQEEYWLNTDSFAFVEALTKVITKARTPITHVRFNEAGDMHSTECLDKMVEIANMLPQIKFYTYTHRKDLVNNDTHKMLPSNLVINTSDFQVDGLNSFNAVEVDFKFQSYMKAATDIKADIKAKYNSNLVCLGDCRDCTLCSVKNHGKKIYVAIH